MYSKATYIKPYLKKFIRVLGIENVGTLNKPKMNVVYAILANNNIRPIDRNKYGVPLFQYRDLDGLNDLSISYGFRKWKDDMLKKDIEMSMRDNKKVHTQRKQKKPDTQTTISFVDERDEQLYESLFGRKVYFTESQIKNIVDKEKYIENDYNEKWERQDINSDIFKTIKSKLDFDNNSNLGLADVAKVVGGECTEPGDTPNYIAFIRGGLNGSGDWKDYLTDMITIIKKINGSYIIDLDVDVPDDVWTLKLGFYKEKLNEGASGYEPEDSDSYFDLCYELSENIFEGLLKHIDKNLKVKNDNAIYTYLGIINHMLKVNELHAPLRYENKDLGKDERLGVKIIKKCIEGYNYLFSDKKENRQGWKDFKEYKRSLTIQYKIFKELMKMLNYDSDVDIVLTEPYHLRESKNFVEPQKVLVVKKFLDDNFVRAAIPTIGEDGYSKTILIVGMKGTDGQVNRNMYAQQLFDLLQDKFQNIYLDKEKRDNFLKRVMKDWYDKKISKDGLLSVNTF
jgi:hypothetical protein